MSLPEPSHQCACATWIASSLPGYAKARGCQGLGVIGLVNRTGRERVTVAWTACLCLMRLDEDVC